MAKKPIRKSPPKPRNVAAKSLRAGQFQPRVEDNPRAYKRKGKHRPPLVPPEEEGDQE